MDLYSLLLALALLATALAWGTLISARLAHRATRLRRARVLAAVAVALGGAAVTWHVARGHRPGTERALDPLGFAREHPALLAALALASVAWLAARPGRPT